jgi:hypothetical protein
MRHDDDDDGRDILDRIAARMHVDWDAALTGLADGAGYGLDDTDPIDWDEALALCEAEPTARIDLDAWTRHQILRWSDRLDREYAMRGDPPLAVDQVVRESLMAELDAEGLEDARHFVVLEAIRRLRLRRN